MKVEAWLVSSENNFKSDGNSWMDLFAPSVINRTMVGVGIMFFQRMWCTTTRINPGQGSNVGLIQNGVESMPCSIMAHR
jgi:hypothetical protein